MTTATVRRALSVGGIEIGATESLTGTGRTGFFEESVADAATDAEITISIDVSAVKAFLVISSQNVTLETNSGGAPVDTITLLAGKPYVFVTGDYNAFLLGTDVTAFFITNASGAAATPASPASGGAVSAAPAGQSKKRRRGRPSVKESDPERYAVQQDLKPLAEKARALYLHLWRLPAYRGRV